MAEYKPGSMDIRDHEKTFDGFVRFSIRASIFCILVLVFMALVNA